MKKMIGLLCLTFLLCSCAVASIDTKKADGTTCTGYYSSLFKDVDSATMGACGAKGGATGSKANTELVGALMKYLLAVP